MGRVLVRAIADKRGSATVAQALYAETPESIEARAAAKQLQHEVKVFVGSSVAVTLKPEGGVERSQGKAKRVVDLRKG